MKKIAIGTDPHCPYEDKYVQNLFLRFINDWKPDVVVLAGDLIDCRQLSPFDRDPRTRQSFGGDLEISRGYLDSINEATSYGTRKIFLGGNHEDRIRKYLWSTAPELSSVEGIDIPDLLGLEERHWEYIPYYDAVGTTGAPGFMYYNILVMHGIFARKHSAVTARAHFERFICNGVNGHTHRQGTYYHRAWGGEFTWIEAGCMCILEPPYMSSPDWQQGWTAGYVFDDKPENPNPRFDLRNVVVNNKKAVWEGKLLKA
jgi:hypothetical protein